MSITSINSLFDLTGKPALITGGGGGIGLACARALASFGASVLPTDISEKYLDEGIRALKQAGAAVGGICADISDPSQAEDIINAAKPLGGIDIFINSAAVTNRKQVLDMTDKEWLDIINTNMNGAFYMGHAVAKQIIKQERGGKVIYIVSTGAYRASVNFGAYSASKAGIVMLLKTLALELAPYKICVNAIAPTATETRFTYDYYLKNPGKKKAVILNRPLGRIAVPEDYMGTAVFPVVKGF
jgi:NAD(P)-dependent dehydrogenase (short-subunit alcohol dehydrogenase family)